MQINYSEKGKGPDVILLHGWGGSLKSLENFQLVLASKGFHVIALDLPGFGSSEAPSRPWGLDDYSEFVINFLKDLKIKKPIVIGHSFGGKLGLKIAIKNPELLSHLVVIDSSGIYPENSAKKTIFRNISKIGSLLMLLPPFFLIKPLIRRLYYKFVVREKDYIQAQGVMQETFKIVIEEHLDKDLKKIQAQTLIIWGENDKQTPLWQGERLAQNIVNSRLEVVKDEGHSLPIKSPEVVAELIYKNLKYY